MSTWQEQVHKTTIGSSTSGQHIPVKIVEVIRYLPNVFGISHDLLIVCYDVDGKENYRTLTWVMHISHHENLKLSKTNVVSGI